MTEHTFISKMYPNPFQVYKSVSMTEKIIGNAKRYCEANVIMVIWEEKPTFCILLEQQKEDFIVRYALIFAKENYNINKRNLNFSVRSGVLVHDQTWGILYHWNEYMSTVSETREWVHSPGERDRHLSRICCVCSLQVSLINALPWPLHGSHMKEEFTKRPSGTSLPS